MRTILASLSALAALTAAAGATDLPSRLPPPVFIPPTPVFSWTGAYAGVNAGIAFDANSGRRTTIVGLPASAGIFGSAAPAPTTGVLAFPGNQTLGGFSGGGQIGFNYQFTPGAGLVVGAEADAQFIDFRVNRTRVVFATSDGLGGFPGTGGIFPGTRVNDPNGLYGLDFFGTVRGRVGYAIDRTLVYATGGLAYGSASGRQFGSASFVDSFRTGWAVGGGVEFALPTSSFLNVLNASAVTVKIEGLYVNLDRDNRSPGLFAINPAGNAVGLSSPGVGLVIGPAGFRPDTQFAIVRAGLNYKFGGVE
jgi:outer membrane immunogenic protein